MDPCVYVVFWSFRWAQLGVASSCCGAEAGRPARSHCGALGCSCIMEAAKLAGVPRKKSKCRPCRCFAKVPSACVIDSGACWKCHVLTSRVPVFMPPVAGCFCMAVLKLSRLPAPLVLEPVRGPEALTREFQKSGAQKEAPIAGLALQGTPA